VSVRFLKNPMYAVMRAFGEQREWSEFFPFFAFTTLERILKDFAAEWFYMRDNGVINRGKQGIFYIGGIMPAANHSAFYFPEPGRLAAKAASSGSPDCTPTLPAPPSALWQSRAAAVL
jgi:hypothetical protein